MGIDKGKNFARAEQANEKRERENEKREREEAKAKRRPAGGASDWKGEKR